MYLYGWNAVKREHVEVTIQVAMLPKKRGITKPYPHVEGKFKNSVGSTQRGVIHDMIVTTSCDQYLISGYQDDAQPLNEAVGRLGESWRGEISVMVLGIGNRYFRGTSRHLKDLDDAVAM